MGSEGLLKTFSLGPGDKLCYSPPTHLADTQSQDYLIFFIPGNPGLVSFYEPFLSRLHSLLSSSSQSTKARYHICGHSFRGFEISPESKTPGHPLSLPEQVQFQENLLCHHVDSHYKATGQSPKVILMGHSVGAYVLLELIQQHRDRVNTSDDEDFDLIGGILLFPTIADIAKSPMGRIAKMILPVPGFALSVAALAKFLVYITPSRALTAIVRTVTGFPDYATKTTTAFIKSSMGVRQALHLAKDEMKMITEPQWTAEVWGAATSTGTNKRDTANSNLVLYWGKGDQWVADNTRDRLIEARGNRPTLKGGRPEEWKPVMLIDQEGIPHDFCTTLRNSNSVADKVQTWIEGIIDSHNKVLTW